MAAGGHLRPARRRLPSLRRRRDLARAALREDALRQRAPRLRVPARLRDHRQASATARSSRRRSTTSSARCCCRREASPRRRTPTRSGEEGLTYVWTLDELHDGARAGRGRGRRPQRYGVTAEGNFERRDRPLRRRRATSDVRSPSARRRLLDARCGDRSRRATTRRSRPGTASPWPRSPRPGCGSTGPTTSTPRGRSPTSCSRP